MDLSQIAGPEIAWLVLALLAGGIVAGLLAGLFGIGGGAVLVPILFELFILLGVPDDIRMHLSVGTSLAVIAPTAIRSFAEHRRRGAVDMAVLRNMGPAVGIGVIAGVVIASRVDGSVLKFVYVLSALLIAAKLLAGSERGLLGTDLPALIWQRLYGFVTGLGSTLIGIGGGIYISAFMTFFGRPIHQAVATASGFGPIIAIPATIGFMWVGWGAAGLPPSSVGYVSLLGAALIIPAGVLAAPFGVRLAHHLSHRKLELAFAAFLILVAVRFLVNLLGA
ncbi:MAG: sulfite exporter TauE/SafE family protein [Methyloceanibacter sp.]|uniref:sulfite exporter TauE/SafE family protein n=1 Tax=Methyloceanibacter sp. TaxID=1965321 RepID=UPI003D9ADF57